MEAMSSWLTSSGATEEERVDRLVEAKAESMDAISSSLITNSSVTLEVEREEIAEAEAKAASMEAISSSLTNSIGMSIVPLLLLLLMLKGNSDCDSSIFCDR